MPRRTPKPAGIPAQPRHKLKRKASRKAALGKLSRQWPTEEEYNAIFSTFTHPDSPPIVTAILGAACLEYELEKMLRPKYRRQDDDTWSAVIGRDGPLSTFSSKITSGYALGLYDDAIRFALDTVRGIRNVFAHSKKPIGFDHEDITAALRSLRLPPKRRSEMYVTLNEIKTDKFKSGSINYVILCLTLFRHLTRKQARSHRLRANYYRRRGRAELAKSVGGQLAGALVQSQQNRPGFLGLFGGLAQLGQTANPNPAAPANNLLGLLAQFAEPPDKTDK